MARLRVLLALVANEPRSYRQAIAAALRQLRPHVEVVAVEPDEMDRCIARLRPDLVICSRLTEAVEAVPLCWVLLYPAQQPDVEVSIAGVRATHPDTGFDVLLAAIDECDRRRQGAV